MKVTQSTRVTTSAAGVRLEWLWWRSWQGWAGIALAIAVVISLYQGAWRVAAFGALAAYVGYSVYTSSLTVEADSSGVSLRRWRSPGRRYRWRDIADVTLQERTNWTSRWPTKSYYCALVLQSGRALRIDPGEVGRRWDDAALVKEHIDQVRGAWDPSYRYNVRVGLLPDGRKPEEPVGLTHASAQTAVATWVQSLPPDQQRSAYEGYRYSEDPAGLLAVLREGLVEAGWGPDELEFLMPAMKDYMDLWTTQ